jgi:uncharacterized repeat protein (TIGR03803 family)
MKIKTLFIAAATMITITCGAQTFAVLHDFNSDPHPHCPLGGLTRSGNNLYGVASPGVIFSINVDGSDYTELYDLGQSPWQFGTLVLSGDTLYGTSGFMVYSIRTNGTNFKVLHNLDTTEGSISAGLALSGNTLYGISSIEIFKVDITSSNFSVLRNLSPSDGQFSESALTVSENMLYGTTDYGGAYTNGTIFCLTTNGTGFAVLHSFTNYGDGTPPGSFSSASPLVLHGTKLYGTTGFQNDGTNEYGRIFSINTDGTGYTNLYSFPATNSNWGNSDSDYPVQPGLTLSGDTLYGVSQVGNAIYSIKTNGSDFKVLYFLNDGVADNPLGTLLLSGQTIYGTTSGGLMGGDFETVFSLLLPPRALMTNIVYRATNNNVLVTGFGGAGYTYWTQATTNLALPASWQTISTNVADTNGLWQITDSLTNGAFQDCQTNFVYAVISTTNSSIGPITIYSTNVIGTNVSCDCSPRRFYRAAAAP